MGSVPGPCLLLEAPPCDSQPSPMTVHESRTSAGLGHGKASGMTELHVNFTQKRHDLYDRRNVKNRLGNTIYTQIAFVGCLCPLDSEV